MRAIAAKMRLPMNPSPTRATTGNLPSCFATASRRKSSRVMSAWPVRPPPAALPVVGLKSAAHPLAPASAWRTPNVRCRDKKCWRPVSPPERRCGRAWQKACSGLHVLDDGLDHEIALSPDRRERRPRHAPQSASTDAIFPRRCAALPALYAQQCAREQLRRARPK